MIDGAEGLYEVLRHVRPLHQYSAKAVADSLAERDVTMPMRAGTCWSLSRGRT